MDSTLAATPRSRSNPDFIILQILDTYQRESVYPQITVCALLLIKLQFVIKKDGGDFLGSHELYYCKCSCVYILETKRSTMTFVVWFIRHIISYVSIIEFENGRYVAI